MTEFKVAKAVAENLSLDKDYILIKYSNERWRKFKSVFIAENILQVAEKKKYLKVFNDDVFVCSYPRSGTTLTQEMVWLMLNNFDFEGAKEKILDERFPELEYVEFMSS